jgi:filamentous hemagglutinin
MVPWMAEQREAFYRERVSRGLPVPDGGWTGYQVHHILPREWGETNDFMNLIPIPPNPTHQAFNNYWNGERKDVRS